MIIVWFAVQILAQIRNVIFSRENNMKIMFTNTKSNEQFIRR